MAWRRSGDKPLSEPMVVKLPTHICVTRPQWVKTIEQIQDWIKVFEFFLPTKSPATTSFFFCLQTLKSFLPSMLSRNHGHVVTIASMAGIVGVNGLIDYCASKFAAVGLNESLSSELDQLEKTGIHTTVVCPGYIKTGMFTGAGIK